MRRGSRADRLYRLLLRLFPSEFRGDFGDEMSVVFRDERADAAAAGRVGLARLWWRTLRGVASTAPREHAQVLVRDAAYGLRLMRAHPLTTAAAMLAIALGVGANTAMFTVVNAVLLQLPFEDPDRLVSVLHKQPRIYSAAIPLPQFRLWADRIDGAGRVGPVDGIESIESIEGMEGMESLAGYAMSTPVWTGAGTPDRLRLECVSASMIPMLGVAPALGRTFTKQEDGPAGAPVIVVSHAFWANRLGRDPERVGEILTLDGMPVHVIGVMPESFDGPRALRRLDGWMPLNSCLATRRAEGQAASAINLYGRLKPDVSPRIVEAQMEAAALPALWPVPDAPNAPNTPASSADARIRVSLRPLMDGITGEVKQPLLTLLGAAGFVLLIACANVASLLLGRADARRRELAVRAALGCSRARLVRQLLTESVVFALCGGAAGLLIAHASLGVLLSLMPGGIRRIDHIALDGRVLAACLVLSTATGLLFGLLPALYASRVDPGGALKESALLGTRTRHRMRGALIVAEVALSVALLVGAGLLMRTFLHLRPADPGFEPAGKVAAMIRLPRARYADGPAWRTFVDQLRERLLQRPGVQAVVATSYVPLSGSFNSAEVQRANGDGSRSVTAFTPYVTFDYFREMGIPIRRGRAFTERDGPGSGVAIVNETMARLLWPGQDPLGQRIVFAPTGFGSPSTKTIVGISRDVRDAGHRLTSRAEVYVAFADEPYPNPRIVVKTTQRPEQVARALREEVAAIDPLLPVGEIETIATTVAQSVATWRFGASLLGAFAGIAVSLAAIGLFAVVGCWVTERTPEIGVRMALGAGRGRVLRLFVGRGALLTAVGLVGGLALAAVTTPLLAVWLVDISPLDRLTFVLAAATMGVVCLLATFLAARRAASIDPMVALRS